MPNRPPKGWWNACVAGVTEKGSAYDPNAVCGSEWYHKKPRAEREAITRAEERTSGNWPARGRQGAHVFPPGARVLVDGRDEAIVKQAFPEGSTSYLFPHYKLDIVGGDRNVAVNMNRVGVERRRPAFGQRRSRRSRRASRRSRRAARRSR